MNPDKQLQNQQNVQNQLSTEQVRLFKKLRIAAFAIWIIALPLTAYVSPDQGGNVSGISCYMFGWLALIGANFIAGLAWLTNFFALIVLNISRTNQPSARKLLVYSALSFFLAFGAFALKSYPKDESGTVYYSVEPGIGLYVWLLAILMSAAIGFYRYSLLSQSKI